MLKTIAVSLLLASCAGAERVDRIDAYRLPIGPEVPPGPVDPGWSIPIDAASCSDRPGDGIPSCPDAGVTTCDRACKAACCNALQHGVGLPHGCIVPPGKSADLEFCPTNNLF